MKKLILLSLILSFSMSVNAQFNKPVIPKPISWDELQLYQLDSLKTAEELQLAATCPSTLKKLGENFENSSIEFQHILGNNYTWSVFTNSSGLKCLVKHDRVDSLTPKEGSIIDPNSYELLDNLQSRILISASLGIMDSEKEKLRKKQIAEAMRIQRERTEAPYKKYGGLQNLMRFMRENTPSYSIDKRLLKNRVTKSKSGNNVKFLSPLELFEIRYSKEQRDQLIEEAKKKLKSKNS